VLDQVIKKTLDHLRDERTFHDILRGLAGHFRHPNNRAIAEGRHL
jgi:hypothetical protein